MSSSWDVTTTCSTVAVPEAAVGDDAGEALGFATAEVVS
jgi:hypothetical protein